MSRSYKQDFGWAPADNSEQRAEEPRGFYGAQPLLFSGPPAGLEGTEFWYPAGAQQNIGLHQNYATINHNTLIPTASVEQTTTIKHRRTRSGCFTCRQRRVKCDETRPVCERCRKGNRQCDFPQPSSTSKRAVKEESAASGRKGSTADYTAFEDASTEEEDDDEEADAAAAADDDDTIEARATTSDKTIQSSLHPMKAESEPIFSDDSHSGGRALKHRPTLSTVGNDISPSSLQQSLGSPYSNAPGRPPWLVRADAAMKWDSLDRSVRECFIFQQKHMTYHHYLLPYDFTNFIHEEFIERALSFEPLLYAAAAFAAYHQTIHDTNGKFMSFWQFYSKSIILLRQFLATNAERNEQVLLTILQLAIFEEYLGDWTNMSTHLRAAQSIWTILYVSPTASHDDVTQKIFHWISRISVTSSMVASTHVKFEREWFTGVLQTDQLQHENDKSIIGNAITYLNSRLRLEAYDLANYLARADQMPLSSEEFTQIGQRLEALRRNLREYHNPEYVINNSRLRPSAIHASLVQPQSPRIPVYRAHLWPLTQLWAVWVSLKQLHISLSIGQDPMSGKISTNNDATNYQMSDNMAQELEYLALAQFEIFDTVHRWLEAPEGAEFCCHVPTSFAALFLRRTPEQIAWARHNLAIVEQMGYIWLPSLRRTLAAAWRIEEIIDWWLPNAEGMSPLLREIREVVEERNQEKGESSAGDEQAPIHDCKAISGRLGIER